MCRPRTYVRVRVYRCVRAEGLAANRGHAFPRFPPRLPGRVDRTNDGNVPRRPVYGGARAPDRGGVRFPDGPPVVYVLRSPRYYLTVCSLISC